MGLLDIGTETLDCMLHDQLTADVHNPLLAGKSLRIIDSNISGRGFKLGLTQRWLESTRQTYDQIFEKFMRDGTFDRDRFFGRWGTEEQDLFMVGQVGNRGIWNIKSFGSTDSNIISILHERSPDATRSEGDTSFYTKGEEIIKVKEPAKSDVEWLFGKLKEGHGFFRSLLITFNLWCLKKLLGYK